MSSLAALMRKHRIRHKDLAFITGRTERAVHQWVHGIRPPPRCATLLLAALDDGRIDEKWLGANLAQYLAR